MAKFKKKINIHLFFKRKKMNMPKHLYNEPVHVNSNLTFRTYIVYPSLILYLSQIFNSQQIE